MPAQNFEARVLRQEQAASSIRLLTVEWNASLHAPKAGQFYMLRAWRAEEAPLLSRPISVHSFDARAGELQFLYEIKGPGTQKLAALAGGGLLRLTGPSGNGFPVEELSGRIAVVGGGIGIAPLFQLVRELAGKGCQVDFYAGFRDVPYRLEAFAAAAESVRVATDSGAYGVKGFVTDLLQPAHYSAVCVCGPEVMMRKAALACREAGVPVYVSKEAKMACGEGACLGCTCHTGSGALSVCKNGPVFEGSVAYG